jgi:hypothetical protein
MICPQRGAAATEVQPANDANEREYKNTSSGGFAREALPSFRTTERAAETAATTEL